MFEGKEYTEDPIEYSDGAKMEDFRCEGTYRDEECDKKLAEIRKYLGIRAFLRL